MANEDTHYILPITERNGRYQLSACNRWVTEQQHSAEPTCAECHAYLVEDSRELSAEDVFGVADPSKVAKSTYAANMNAHLSRQRLRTS